MNDRKELLDYTLQLAGHAEEVILKHYGKCKVDIKPDGSEVTEADKEAEDVITKSILTRFPNDKILGEEFGESNSGNTGRKWIIDPIDGTTWFTLGIPTFGTLIALLEDDKPVIGVIHFPALGETVYSAKDLGCWFKMGATPPSRIYVDSTVANLNESIISAAGVHGSHIFSGGSKEIYNLTEVINESKKFRFCGDCIQHSLVCRGRIHAGIDTIMKPWDSAAIIPCIEEAGGVVSDLSGNREEVVYSGSLLTSANNIIHEQILKLLNS